MYILFFQLLFTYFACLCVSISLPYLFGCALFVPYSVFKVRPKFFIEEIRGIALRPPWGIRYVGHRVVARQAIRSDGPKSIAQE